MEGPHPARPRGGRPSRGEAEALGDRILEIATELLLAQGYGATSIEAIAARARVSKRTFYHRFPDKAALMRAVVERLINSLRPPAEVPLFEGSDLERILVHLADLILQAALSPKVLALQRLIVAEAQRFPDLASAVALAGGRREAVTLIADLLRRFAPAGKLEGGQAEFAAEQFLQMVVSVPQLRALGLGGAMNDGEIAAWGRRSVALFLKGVWG